MKSKPLVFVRLLRVISIIEFITALIVNPWVGEYWRSVPMENFSDVMQIYFCFAIFISMITFLSSVIISKTNYEISKNFTLLALILSLIILSDRLLLVKFGYSLWEFDSELIYRHRPNIVRSWGPEFSNKLIKINTLGFHDNEVSISKTSDEFRIFILGNSITMGHGVTREETFSNQLERILYKTDNSKSFEVINMGVQGYSTFQELGMLKRYFNLKPDLIIVGFCLNDVIEPFNAIKKFGGIGFDYHKVDQSEHIIKNFFFNSTGYGKLINHIKFNDKIQNAKQKELGEVYDLCKDSVNYAFSDKWQVILNYLNMIYNICENNNIPCILLIFPYTFQFFHEDLISPQKILTLNASKFNVKYIDFVKIFENLIISNKRENESIEQSQARFINAYYLDEDHFSTNGHILVANKLFQIIKNYISIPPQKITKDSYWQR